MLPVDKCRIQFIVDNTVDSLSTGPEFVETAWQHQIKHQKMKTLSGSNFCCACHGFSVLVSTTAQDNEQHLLFDTGPEGNIFISNTEKLAIDLAKVNGFMLSHGHFDHAGGVMMALKHWRALNPHNTVPFYVNKDMFVKRALILGENMLPFEDIASIDELTRAGANVVDTGKKPYLALNDHYYISGEITRTTSYEQGFINHCKLDEVSNEWVPDPRLDDERFLAVHIKDKGLAIFSACSHAGIVNVVKQAKQDFPNIPLYAIIGGFHLAGKGMETRIEQTVHDLKAFNIPLIIPGHCTGYRAEAALLTAMGDNTVIPSAAGKVFNL